MSKQDILGVWQEVHGPINGHWKSLFLERSELDEIILYPRHAIEEALTSSPKLTLVLRVLRRKWVNADSSKTSIPLSKKGLAPSETSKRLWSDVVSASSTARDSANPPKGKPEVPTADLAAQGKILPLPDNPGRSRKRGSPGYRTGIEAELRDIAQQHRWF